MFPNLQLIGGIWVGFPLLLAHLPFSPAHHLRYVFMSRRDREQQVEALLAWDKDLVRSG